eukprot:TRINITY_DN96772_c0_g1_i1.p1 TRINITY_DN96772_c0_g1~~TRINITY_DN96772_c0_g1_i1.p1  ORF type:complete len:359 (-),score=53.27 TRINITY_DN96772_c0_g1_i1:317-1393(-)
MPFTAGYSRVIKSWAARAPKEPLTRYEFVADPLGPSGLEVRVTHCAVCGSDLHLMRSEGGYDGFGAFPDPQVCGHEIIGMVTNMGSDVSTFKLGQRVGIGWQCESCHECEWCLRGDEQLCEKVKATCCEGNRGGFADFIRIKDSRFAFPIPEALDSAATAPLLCGGVTVWTPLQQQTKEGDRVGILGLGGLGHMAIQFASKLGRHVTAISSSLRKKDEALAMGAHAFLSHGDEEAMEAAAGSLDFILVTLATAQPMDFSKFFLLLRKRGTLCFVGMCPPITADVFTMTFTMHRITSSNTGGIPDVVSMLEFCAEHGIGAHVKTRPMEEINETITELTEQQVPFRYVLTNPDPSVQSSL